MAEANKVVQLKSGSQDAAPKKADAQKAEKPAAKKPAEKKGPAKAKAKPAVKKTTVKKKAAAKKSAPKKAIAKKSAPKSTASKSVAKAAPADKKVADAKAEAQTITKKTSADRKATKKPIAKKKTVKKAAPKKAATQTVKKAIKKAVKKPTVASFTKPQTNFKTPNPFNTKQLEAIMTQPNFDKAQKQFDQFTKEAANLNREGIDAFVKSGTIFAKGFENIMKETMSFAQSSAEKQMKLAKDAMTCKTINEFSDAQNKLAKTSFDDFMSGTTKITELGVKVLTDSIEPISEQVQKSVQKATDAVAAE